jgi:hypothetical protein
MLLSQFFSHVPWMTQSANANVSFMSLELHLEDQNQLSTVFKCILLNLVNLKLLIPQKRVLFYLLSSTCSVTNLNVNIFKWKLFDTKQNHLKRLSKCLDIICFRKKGNLRLANHKLNIHDFNWVSGVQTYYFSIRTSYQMIRIMACCLSLSLTY